MRSLIKVSLDVMNETAKKAFILNLLPSTRIPIAMIAYMSVVDERSH
jgi:hypothetical protein